MWLWESCGGGRSPVTLWSDWQNTSSNVYITDMFWSTDDVSRWTSLVTDIPGEGFVASCLNHSHSQSYSQQQCPHLDTGSQCSSNSLVLTTKFSWPVLGDALYRQVLAKTGGKCIMTYKCINSTHCTPSTSTVLYVNYISIKLNNMPRHFKTRKHITLQLDHTHCSFCHLENMNYDHTDPLLLATSSLSTRVSCIHTSHLPGRFILILSSFIWNICLNTNVRNGKRTFLGPCSSYSAISWPPWWTWDFRELTFVSPWKHRCGSVAPATRGWLARRVTLQPASN